MIVIERAVDMGTINYDFESNEISYINGYKKVCWHRQATEEERKKYIRILEEKYIEEKWKNQDATTDTKNDVWTCTD